jgi:uncharacterized DUF497 family protein
LTNGLLTSNVTVIAVIVAGIEWDHANRDKCRKHGVPIAAIEAAFHRPIAVFPDPSPALKNASRQWAERMRGGMC